MAGTSSGFTGPAYYNDCIGPLLFDPFAADLVQRLPNRPPGDVLEIACGTGLMTRRIRERIDSTLRVVATDLSTAMLDYARTKLGDGNGIEWQQADALALPFDDRTFGAVVCGFGIMFVPDRQAMLKEARRVLVDGGTLLFNVWDRIENNPHAAVNAAVVEAMFPGDAEMRFRTPYEMHDAENLRQLLAVGGFRETLIETKRIAINGADPKAIATGQIRGTPRSVLIEKRDVSLDIVIAKVADALATAGGNPYFGYGQAIVVQAQAI
jgi:SAM-dependent methyltransferase